MSEAKEKKSLKSSDVEATPGEIPSGFLDPATQSVMVEPILSDEGISYGKNTAALSEKKTHIPNLTLKKIYAEYIQLPPVAVSQHIQTFLDQELSIFNLQQNLDRLMAQQCGVSLSASYSNTPKQQTENKKIVPQPSEAAKTDSDKKPNPLTAKQLFINGEASYQRYNFLHAIPLLLQAAKYYPPAFSLLWQIYHHEKFYFKQDVSAPPIAEKNRTLTTIYLNLIITSIPDFWQLACTDPIGMHYLGECYIYGHGFLPDKNKALAWHERSAQHDYGTALYEMSKHHEPLDAKKAQIFSKRSADKGCMFAMLTNFTAGLNSPMEQKVFGAKHLVFLYHAVKDLLDQITTYRPEKIKGQFYLLNIIAIEGHTLAENLLARWYTERELDIPKAIYWSYRAAQKGQEQSQHRLTDLLTKYPQYSTLIYPATPVTSMTPLKQLQIPEQETESDEDDSSSLPSAFCPITHQLIVHPSVIEPGHSYETAAIIRWLGKNRVDPLTKKPIKDPVLSDNPALSQVLATYKLRTLLPSYIAQQNQQLLALKQEIAWREQQLQKPSFKIPLSSCTSISKDGKLTMVAKPPISQALSGSVGHFGRPTMTGEKRVEHETATDYDSKQQVTTGHPS